MKNTIVTFSLLLSVAVALAAGDKPKVIDQKDKLFSQEEIVIKPGDALVFSNSDSVTHNVFSNSKVNAFKIQIQKPGEKSTVVFTNAGVTEVRCAIHPKMKLLVKVQP